MELDVCITASVLLKGEQNINLPSVGSEQYATHLAPQISLFPPSLNTCAHSIAPGEGNTLVQHADPCLEVLKPPDWNEPPLEESGGVPLGLIHMAEKAGAEASERAVVDMREPGEVSLDAHTAPAPTEGITSIKPTSRAVVATATRPEVLEPRAEGMAWRRHEMPLPPPGEGLGEPGSPPCEVPSMGTCRCGPEALPLPPREDLPMSKHRPKRVPQRTPPPLPREDSGYPGLLL